MRYVALAHRLPGANSCTYFQSTSYAFAATEPPKRQASSTALAHLAAAVPQFPWTRKHTADLASDDLAADGCRYYEGYALGLVGRTGTLLEHTEKIRTIEEALRAGALHIILLHTGR